MAELIQIVALATTLFATLFFFVNELRKKDEQLLSYQKALVEAYTEIELMKLGVMK
jgi:hypothetical protein